MRAAAIAALLVLPLTGCPWPPYFEDPPRSRNMEPRIIRAMTTPMFEKELITPEEAADPRDPLEVDICVWEPDLDDVVRGRIYVDYAEDNAVVHARIFELTPTHVADQERPEERCARIVYDAICVNETPDGTVRMVDFVIASAWNDLSTAVPENRASISGHTDEIRIKVTCKDP